MIDHAYTLQFPIFTGNRWLCLVQVGVIAHHKYFHWNTWRSSLTIIPWQESTGMASFINRHLSIKVDFVSSNKLFHLNSNKNYLWAAFCVEMLCVAAMENLAGRVDRWHHLPYSRLGCYAAIVSQTRLWCTSPIENRCLAFWTPDSGNIFLF